MIYWPMKEGDSGIDELMDEVDVGHDPESQCNFSRELPKKCQLVPGLT